MAGQPGTLQGIGTALTLALKPLQAALAGVGPFQVLMSRLGWRVTGLPPQYSALGSAVEAAVQKFDTLGDNPSASDIFDLLGKAVAAFNAIQSISVAPPGVDAAAFLAEIGDRLFELLLVDYLTANLPAIYNLLSALNVISLDTSASAAGRPAFVRVNFNWNALLQVVGDPLAFTKKVYNWGTPDFDTLKVIDHLAGMFAGLNFPASVRTTDKALLASYLGVTDPTLPSTKSLNVPFYYITIAGQNLEAGFALRMLPAAAAKLPGLAIEPRLPSQFPLSLKLRDDIQLRLRAGTNAAEQFGIVLRPNEASILYPFAPGTTPPSAGIGVGFDFTPASPVILFGDADHTRLQFQGAAVDLAADVRVGKLETSLGADLDGLTLVIRPADADGFLSTILGGADVTLPIPAGIAWSNLSGVSFKGSGGFEVTLSTHLSLGPIDIDAVSVKLGLTADPPQKIALEVGASILADLGPLSVAIDHTGIGVYLLPQKGNAGPIDLSIGFLPPNGVGLSIDAAVIKGGGFLSIDTARGQYAGILQLTIADFLNVTAIGLIETKLPDGSNGFSLLIIITADFGAGFQLGFGFTLLAVGGLLGLNRGMLFQPIMDAIRTNAITSVLFPQNVIANAQRIISDLQAFFPVHKGTFLIGPMAKLGWGEPTLVSLSLGVIIEIPPGDIAILGILKLALPADEIAILTLQVNFAGAIEVDKKRIYFYAALFDSHLLFITIDGAMGLLVAWGDDANFVVSIGGFHPNYNPPPLPFPTPQRISINLINESFARIHADGYFAVTSNTVQFGTHSDYFFGFSALNVQGASSFDALIQFSPFHFEVSFSTSFSVNIFGIGCYGIDIGLAVTGPTPFHASGTASISFFFFSIGINIDFTWGDSRDTTLPPVAVMPLLVDELNKQSNWRALLPAGANLMVTLRKLDPSETAIVLHPVGTLQVSQRRVPLDLTLDKFGNQQPTDANFFSLNVTSPDLVKTRDLQERFAPSEFKASGDAQKLSQPGYVPLDSGIELAVGGITLDSATAITRNVRYDLTIIDTKLRRVFVRFYQFAGAVFRALLNGGSVAHSTLSANYDARVHPFTGSVTVSPETFAVAFTSNNTLFHTEAAAFTSQAAANDYVARAVTADATLTGTLHVLPNFELAA
jgi:hypothetical protein